MTSTSEVRPATHLDASTYKQAHANGTDIHYIEAGQGRPLILLHGGMVSASPLWMGVPVAYASHIDTFAEHFRVIAPDARGSGRTVDPAGGAISYTHFADDVVALIEALELDKPALCGFSDGGITATLAGIRKPDVACAIVNDAGFDMLNPETNTFAMSRSLLGGSPDATRADPDAAEQFFSSSDQMRTLFEMMKADNDSAQGEGHWRTYIGQLFDRGSQSPGYTFEDLESITVPTLIMTGDKDMFCSVEEAVTAFRSLAHGELAILPSVEHVITPMKVQIAIDFLKRHGAA